MQVSGVPTSSWSQTPTYTSLKTQLVDWEPCCGHQRLVSTSLPCLILGKTRAITADCCSLPGKRKGPVWIACSQGGLSRCLPSPTRFSATATAGGCRITAGPFVKLWFTLCLMSTSMSFFFFFCVSSFQLLQIMLRAVYVCVSFNKFLTFKITDPCVFYGPEWETVIYTHCMLFWFCLIIACVCGLCLPRPATPQTVTNL